MTFPLTNLEYYLNLRYEGTDTAIMIHSEGDKDFLSVFRDVHKREFGFNLDERK